MTAAHDEEPRGGEVLPFRPPVDVEIVAVDDETIEQRNLADNPSPSRVRQAVVAVTDRRLPTRRDIVISTRWWSRRLPRLLLWAPILLLCELAPIARGLGRVASRWAAWVQCVELADAVKEAQQNERSKAAERLTKRRSARTWGSLFLFAVLVGLGWWVAVAQPLGLAGAAIVAVVVLDVIGRQGRKRPDPVVPRAAASVLQKDVPLSQITASILATFTREGFEEGSVTVAAPLTWDEVRHEYRIKVKTADQIKPDHVQAIERAVGARDGAIRNLATGTASVRELVIRVGDPLAHVDQPSWIETSSRSVVEALDLGESSGDREFALKFAGAHVAIIGMTGAGKTKGLIWTIIDRLSACHDAVLWGIDLAAGPALPMWRDVIQKKAFTPEDADELLDKAIGEIGRRMRILTALAEDDDPANDADEWHTGLGPHLFIVIDEFALLAECDGSKGKVDLLGKVEQIERTGRKVWVTVIMGTQKSGNSDFGSTTTSTQVAIKILMACDEADTVRLLSTAHRDAGWSPHLLSPAVEGDVRDAGKCYLESPAHRTPDIYRTYAPMSPGEVKRRARQRSADGLPSLDGRRVDVLDVVEVPPIVAGVELAFAECDADRLPTTDLIEFLAERGITVTDQQLSEAMKIDGERIGERWREVPGGPQIRGYTREAVARKIRSLG